MTHTDTVESTEARSTTRRNRSGDRAANLNLQPRRIGRAEGEAASLASHAARYSIRRKGTVIRGRPVRTVEPQTEE